MSAVLWAPRAWLDGGWATGVTLRADAFGRWAEVRADTPCPPGAERLPAAVVPGMVNAHSHSFQRAFVGLSEQRDFSHDDFWSWRDRMYGVALRITPDQLRDVTTHLYAELLQGGFTHVCEFHYLHTAEDGASYAAHGMNEAVMCEVIADAAEATGMRVTLLPVLYQRAGFTSPALRPDQRRFNSTVDMVLRLRDTVRGWRRPGVTAGVAAHSLRAATPDAIHALVAACAGDEAPIHIHASEQVGEVEDCLAATGRRPIAWLAEEVPLDARWHLVHATHTVPSEIAAVAASGAGVVFCPGTEANLGDGLCDLPRWLAHGVPMSIGTDSHVTRRWPSEVRRMEYGQRLARRQRNVAADPRHQPSTAARLVERCLAGGAAAAGEPVWGLRVGAPADLLVVHAQDSALVGIPDTHLLDALVFGEVARPFARVMVSGRWVPQPDTAPAFARAMRGLWG